MDDKIVGTVTVESSQIAAFTTLADELGVTITFEKPIKFEDLGLAELEKGQFQCLMCRYEFLYVLVFLACKKTPLKTGNRFNTSRIMFKSNSF